MYAYGRFEVPLKFHQTHKFFEDYGEFEIAIREPYTNPVGIIITYDKESTIFIKLKLAGIKNIIYQEI